VGIPFSSLKTGWPFGLSCIQIPLSDTSKRYMLTTNTAIRIRPYRFLSHAGLGRRIVEFKEKENLFTLGDLADSVFYLQHGGLS